MNPESVFCPTCLAKPGQQCRSIMPWSLGIKWGNGTICNPHRKRILKANEARFKVQKGGKNNG